MKITSLVENTSKSVCKAKHGLSLYIETSSHRILFDLGPDDTLFENARRMDIDLSLVDTVIISHGHVDHGGALKKFLAMNSKAKVYVQRSAFDPHYSKVLFLKVSVGLDASLLGSSQIVLLDGDFVIDDELSLFTVSDTSTLRSPMNNVLYDRNGMDSFSHEQNLVIKDGSTVLVMGCGHAGVINIMKKAKAFGVRACIGGFHLYNPISKKSVSSAFLSEISAELGEYADVDFFTCHCTGEFAFGYLSEKLANIKYLSCGEILEV